MFRLPPLGRDKATLSIVLTLLCVSVLLSSACAPLADHARKTRPNTNALNSDSTATTNHELRTKGAPEKQESQGREQDLAQTPASPSVPTEDPSIKPKGRMRLLVEEAMDQQSSGGQPGLTKLSIPEVKLISGTQFQLTSSKIELLPQPGMGWRKKQNELKGTFLQIPVGPSELSVKAIDEVKKASPFQYIQIGCNSSIEPLTKNLTEKKLPQQSTTDFNGITKRLWADTIVLCGEIDIAAQKNVSYIAKKLILIGAKIAINGNEARLLNIFSEQLVLSGENEILTYGPNGPMTTAVGPTIDLTTLLPLEGNGTLKIRTFGGNYKKPDLR